MLMRNLREYRINNGFTRRLMAELLGISISHYDKLERGERNPSANVLAKSIIYFSAIYDTPEIMEMWGFQ